MRSIFKVATVLVLFVAAGNPVIATDDGTWHGDGSTTAKASSFCGAVSQVAGKGLGRLCNNLIG